METHAGLLLLLIIVEDRRPRPLHGARRPVRVVDAARRLVERLDPVAPRPDPRPVLARPLARAWSQAAGGGARRLPGRRDEVGHAGVVDGLAPVVGVLDRVWAQPPRGARRDGGPRGLARRRPPAEEEARHRRRGVGDHRELVGEAGRRRRGEGGASVAKPSAGRSASRAASVRTGSSRDRAA